MYSQLDPKWTATKIGSTNLTIRNYGCTLTCLAWVSRRGKNAFNPKELALDKTLTNASGEVLWNKVFAKIGGVEKYERRYGELLPKVETDQSLLLNVAINTSYGKHWVVWNGSTILDPLGGVEKPLNHYKVLGYNLITWNKKPTSKLIKSPTKPDVYLYNGKMRFPLPNWETLVFLFGEKAYIAELPEREVEAIPMGAMVPKMG